MICNFVYYIKQSSLTIFYDRSVVILAFAFHHNFDFHFLYILLPFTYTNIKCW